MPQAVPFAVLVATRREEDAIVTAYAACSNLDIYCLSRFATMPCKSWQCLASGARHVPAKTVFSVNHAHTYSRRYSQVAKHHRHLTAVSTVSAAQVAVNVQLLGAAAALRVHRGSA